MTSEEINIVRLGLVPAAFILLGFLPALLPRGESGIIHNEMQAVIWAMLAWCIAFGIMIGYGAMKWL